MQRCSNSRVHLMCIPWIHEQYLIMHVIVIDKWMLLGNQNICFSRMYHSWVIHKISDSNINSYSNRPNRLLKMISAGRLTINQAGGHPHISTALNKYIYIIVCKLTEKWKTAGREKTPATIINVNRANAISKIFKHLPFLFLVFALLISSRSNCIFFSIDFNAAGRILLPRPCCLCVLLCCVSVSTYYYY